MSGYAAPAAQPANILDRVTIATFHGVAGANLTLTSMPAALTLLAGSARHIKRVDLSGCRQVRFFLAMQGVAGSAGSKMLLRYFGSYSGTASDYLDIGTSEVSVAMTSTATLVATSWIDLAAGARADVYLAVITSGGNGATSPQVGLIEGQFR